MSPDRTRGTRRRRILQLASAALTLACAVAALRVALWKPAELVGEAPSDGWLRLGGVVHVHTTLSDGGGTPEEVVGAARAIGLDFVAITDHNNFDAKPLEGYAGKTLVLVGSELSMTRGHYLALGIDKPPPFVFSRDPKDDIVDVHELGGFGFAAHPTSPRADLAFSAWDMPGDWGVEILNGDSEWRSAGLGLVRTLALYPLNRTYALLDTLRPPDEALRRWDALLRERDTVGIFGADTHGRIALSRRRFLRFPSYEALFSVARNHVLVRDAPSGDFTKDARAVLEAIRSGRLYVGLDGLAPAGEVSFVVSSAPARRTYTMGERVPWGEDLEARVAGRMPRGTEVVLLRDGNVVTRGIGGLVVRLTAPGVYRVEARVPGWTVPWVITNPVSVFAPEIQDARTTRAAWPAPTQGAPHMRILDAFGGKSPFSAEADQTSSIIAPWQKAGEGRNGGPAARLTFHLGTPSPGRPNVWCALVDRTARNLQPFTGLTFWLKADGAYRLWVQVRDENPASADEGQEWWFASVKTSSEWRQVSVPFSLLRSINPRTDGRLDLDKVKALVFVIDHAAVPPGTDGTIWIDELGVY